MLFGRHKWPPLIEIGLTDLPKSGGAMAPLTSPGTTTLWSKAKVWTIRVLHQHIFGFFRPTNPPLCWYNTGIVPYLKLYGKHIHAFYCHHLQRLCHKPNSNVLDQKLTDGIKLKIWGICSLLAKHNGLCPTLNKSRIPIFLAKTLKRLCTLIDFWLRCFIIMPSKIAFL